MLVLGRKEHQSILIGDSIEISISEISEGQVKLAIQAPREINIVRKEISKPIQLKAAK